MPINVFGNSSNISEHKIDTSLFVKKSFNQYRIKNLPDPISIREAASKNYVDKLFNDSSIVKNNAHINLNDRNNSSDRFFQVNQSRQIDSHLTAELYVDNAIDESSLVRNDQDNDFNNTNLTNISCITLNTQAVNDNQVITKAYVDQFHQENERLRRDLAIDLYDESSDIIKNNQNNDLNVNTLTHLDSITIQRNPTSDNELAKKIC